MSTPEERIKAAREAREAYAIAFEQSSGVLPDASDYIEKLTFAASALFAAVDDLAEAKKRIAELERELAFLKSERVPPAYFAPLLPKK